jgi:hypothetical protein
MKTLRILVVVLAVLVGLLLVQRHQRNEIVVTGPAATIKIDPEKVTRVTIRRPGESVELERAGSEWKLTKPVTYPANGDLVQGMLKQVEELNLEDVISKSPASRATYQVDSTGTTVELWTGDKRALGMVVGKSSSDWTHTFVRYSDRNEVYRADGVIAYSFNRKGDEWRDKTIFKLEPKNIQQIHLDYPKEKQSIALVRADSTHWKVQEGSAAAAAADSGTAARLVANVARLLTVGFATPAEAAGKDFGQPDFRLAVQTATGTQGVNFLTVDEAKMLAKADGNATLFSLYKSNLGNIMKKAEELRTGKGPEPASPAVKPHLLPAGKPPAKKPRG